MTDRPLKDRIYTALAAEQLPLPVHSASATRAAALLQAGPPSVAELATLIGSDPVLACSLFRAANSAFYHGLPKAVTIHEALARIGPERAAAVIGQSCRQGQLVGRKRLLPRYLPALWSHALGCALGAHWLASRCGYRALAERAQLAGLLHDIGKWPLLAVLELLADGEGGIVVADPLVDEVLDNLHIDVGLRLLAEWHLPDELLPAVGKHHQGVLEGEALLVVLVRMANLGCHKVGLGWVHNPDLVLPATAEAQLLGIDEIALAEYEIMLEDRFQLLPVVADGYAQPLEGECR